MWLYILSVTMMVLCGYFAIRARQLLASVLWLAGLSVLLSVVLYLLNAPEIAVIELSVGAGLVTVLFVFAIGIAGDITQDLSTLVPRWLAWTLIAAAVLLLAWALWPAYYAPSPASTGRASSYAATLWEVRAGDMLVAIVLILAGVLGMLNLLLPTQESGAMPDGQHRDAGEPADDALSDAAHNETSPRAADPALETPLAEVQS